MTGFARHSGSADGLRWVWELRSVNGKGLDVRLRLPSGYEDLETKCRKIAGEMLSRGNVQISLNLERESGASAVSVNEAALSTVCEAIRKIDKDMEAAPSTAAQILALRGVLETAEPEDSDKSAATRRLVLLDGLETALKALVDHRATEGASLASVLSGQLDAVEQLAKSAEADPSHAPDTILVKLTTQIEQLMKSDTALDSTRLHQEAALLATKADVREEIDRLNAHCQAARDLLAAGSPVGRKLEFLAQEFNRETNTLCSKSNAVSLTAIGLELKAVIDQFREQSLNVE